MLLTLKPPSLPNGFSSPHAGYSPLPLPSSKTPSGSIAAGGSLPPLPATDDHPRAMSTPHRGLPPPLAMTLGQSERPMALGQSDRQLPLAQPERQQPPPPPSQPMGNLPAPPNQWQGADEPMRNWLAAKAEEDKRKQEEEKTRQETLKLEQRRIEHAILRESIQGGVPPHMVPIVFAGMGGGSLTNASMEWASHHISQLNIQHEQHQQHQQQQQQQQQHQQNPLQVQAQPPPALQPTQGSPDIRRERAATGPSQNPYGSQLPPAVPGASMQPQASGFQASFPLPGISADRLRQGPANIQAAPLPTSQPRLPAQSGLARLNTGDMQINQPPQSGIQLAGHHPLQQSQTAQQQEQQSTSPSIFFHHWQPPNSQKEPPTSSAKSQQSSPYAQSAASHLRSDYQNSPKKRKTTSSSQHSQSARSPETSPRGSQFNAGGRRRAHSNQQSSAFTRDTQEGVGQSTSRPQSRARQQSTSEAESGSQGHGSETQSRDLAGTERKHSRESGTPKREAEGPP